MNPWYTIGTAFVAVISFGLHSVTGPEWDTAGQIPPATVYAPAVAGEPLPDASGSDMSVFSTMPPYTGPGCREWAETALRAGFVLDDLWIALQVMEMESMCLPNAIGDNGQSYGLMQINSFWCKPSTYWPRGYLQTWGLLNECQELMDPALNLHVAWHIATKHGWENWTTYRRLP